MPWCPKCKSEYREGFTICADCGCELVEEELGENTVSLTFGEAEQMEALADFLRYSGIRDIRQREDDSDGQVELLVSRQDLEKASAAVRVFLLQENQRIATESGEEECVGDGEREAAEHFREAAAARRTLRRSSLYQDSSQKADDNRSSGWMLLIIGILGLTVVVLGTTGVIHLKLSNSYLFYGVMGAVFLLFLVAGAISIKNATIFARRAESENSLRTTMLEWCRGALQAEEIDGQVKGEDISEEILYFSRTAYIKERLNHQFVNLDQDFLDQFVDDQVYGMIFEQKD